ncbi:MAG TPA: hypothetical protein VNM89_06280 [Solirubrobacterales bacterium]|nr:hypothetical protein [Solirubrobacterales bacterium]
MRGLKRGPELKMPELRMPRFLVDLFYDLHDRRLLPLVALVIVAIVAVPFLLGGDSEIPEAAEPPVPLGASASSIEAGELTVVRAAPGLRDYRKRLSGRRPTDPFEQRYTGPMLKGAKLQTQTTTESTSSSTTTTTTTGTSGDSPSPSSSPEPPVSSPPSDGGDGGDGGSAPSGDGGGKTTTAEASGYTIDVRIVHKGKEQVRKSVPEMTKLPGEKTAAVMFMGATGGGKKALLLVSSDVVSVLGDAKCSLGSETCDLLAVEPGFPETFVYGANSRRYRITILKIEPAR